jgi:DNA-binding response OmpR family regulator
MQDTRYKRYSTGFRKEFKMPKKILLVDDDEDLRWGVSRNLSSDKELYELVTASSGEQAVEALSKSTFDLVITDFKMPGITGLDLLIKINEEYPKTKVVIMTGYDSEELQREANIRGSLYYISKPFAMDELRKLIVDALTRKTEELGLDFRLRNLIQMNCLGELTNAIVVDRDGQSGIIYFKDGNVVHAETGNLSGEEAFYEILKWDRGKFTLKSGMQSSKQTINQDWKSLLQK